MGANLRMMTLINDVCCWSMILSKYIQEAVKKCDIHIKEHYDSKYDLLKEAANPFAYHYKPEVDVSEPLDVDMASYYQSIIDIM